jgi:hypothetical protein
MLKPLWDGASIKPDRYSPADNYSFKFPQSSSHSGWFEEEGDIDIEYTFDTAFLENETLKQSWAVTLYLNPVTTSCYYDFLINLLKPKRVLF